MLYFLFSFWIGGIFTKFYASAITHDTVSGRFYKPQKGAMSFVVKNPIYQIITYSSDTMIVYYPNRKKAFKFKSVEDILLKNSNITDFKTYISLLRKSGYIFLKKQHNGDTITSYWSNEKQKVILKLSYDKKGRVYEINVQTEKGKILYSTRAEDYVTFKDTLYFPQKVITTTTKDTEIFVFDSIKVVPFNALPEFIKKPILPDSVSVEIKGFDEK